MLDMMTNSHLGTGRVGVEREGKDREVWSRMSRRESVEPIHGTVGRLRSDETCRDDPDGVCTAGGGREGGKKEKDEVDEKDLPTTDVLGQDRKF